MLDHVKYKKRKYMLDYQLDAKCLKWGQDFYHKKKSWSQDHVLHYLPSLAVSVF